MNRGRHTLFAIVASALGVMTMPAAGQSRGELLYFTNCQTCHSEQVHWRDNRLATNWSSLVAQVRRWQSVGRLGWNDEDIREVARFLNEEVYNFLETADTLTSWQGIGPDLRRPAPDPAVRIR